jgi:hypothetical protein
MQFSKWKQVHDPGKLLLRLFDKSLRKVWRLGELAGVDSNFRKASVKQKRTEQKIGF